MRNFLLAVLSFALVVSLAVHLKNKVNASVPPDVHISLEAPADMCPAKEVTQTKPNPTRCFLLPAKHIKVGGLRRVFMNAYNDFSVLMQKDTDVRFYRLKYSTAEMTGEGDYGSNDEIKFVADVPKGEPMWINFDQQKGGSRYDVTVHIHSADDFGGGSWNQPQGKSTVQQQTSVVE
jgi:hypothetical protein